ncbi:UPF0182 family protein [Kitasatospora sp. RB6PN24]|uniref:UPF0182 family membrane protein n=1 Tax=Kitasatospora humi TaxID=2893891 RepID=UPI001E28FD29|nr:UPF0182 family protein [Kitasatospora humi]
MPDRGGPASRARGGPPSRRAKVLLLTAAALVVVFLAFMVFAGVWTDWLWFRSVHYSSVFRTRLVVESGLFGGFGLVMAVACAVNMWLAYRLRPPLSAMSPEQHSLDRYRTGIGPHRRRLLLGVSLLMGLVAGGAAAGHWRLWLLWTDGTPFGVRDAQFHLDVAFYAFDLPWYQFLLAFAFSVVVVSVLGALLVHYLYGGLRLQGPGRRASVGAQGQLAVLLGLFVLLKAVGYWLDRYALAVKTGAYKGVAGYTGLRYVDANAYLPAKTILCCVALICAVLFFLTPVRRTWAPALLGFGLMVLSAVLIGGLYPAIVQQFQVKPDEQAKETPYLRQNIDATRQAYGISDVRTSRPVPAESAGAGAPAPDAHTIADIRLLDPNIVSPTFQQLEQQRSYYGFPSTLDVDRYPTADGGVQDTVIGVRELDLSGVQQRNWINDHFKYTHGYGVVAAKANQVDDRGQPVFTESGLPATGALGGFEQRIYYGEKTTDYAIVGGTNREIDYTSDNGQQTYRYQGDSGVSLDDPITRAAYAVEFGEPQLLYSGAIGGGARVLYDRTPEQRVAKVAPWLTVDADPYPVVQNGRLLWVLDGYTTSDGYPFSSRTTLGSATEDSLSGSRGTAIGADRVNYIRDSVKATVDAYTGEVTLYQWDAQDPVLKTWMKAFPGTVEPRSAIPAGLLPHLRYPQDLFKVQRDMLGMYHMTDPSSFFSGTDIWQVPADPTSDRGQAQPPYYLTVRMPGAQSAAFSLTSTFVPSKRENLAAFMAVDSDPGPDYGTIRILQVPSDSGTPGPGQVQAKFNSDGSAAVWLSQVKNGGDSQVEYGNLLTLPVGGGFLNVEPVYVKARGARYPVLQKVLAVYGTDTVVFDDTLHDALAALFDGGGGAGGVAPPGGAGGSAGSGGASAAPPAVSGDVDSALRKALEDARKADTDAQNALRAGDWAAYGAAEKALQEALNEGAVTGPQASLPASPSAPSPASPSASPPASPASPASPSSASPGGPSRGGPGGAGGPSGTGGSGGPAPAAAPPPSTGPGPSASPSP